MKKLILSASAMALLGAGVLTSCSQEDVTQPNLVKSNEIGLSVAGIQTRAATDPQATALASGNFVGAFNVETSAQGKYEAGSNNTLSALNALTGQPGAIVNVVAYAPYNEDWNSNGAYDFSVATDQSGTEGYIASDLVYAESTPATVGETTPLTFTHKLAQLKVNFVTKGNVKLDNAEVTVTNIANRASIDLTTGTVTKATQGNATIQTLTIPQLESTTTAYAVIVPQTIAGGTKLVKISTGSQDYIASTSAEVEIKSGKSYSFTVTVGVDDAELSLGKVTITDWSGNNTIEGGQVGADQYASFGKATEKASYENGTFRWEENGASVPMFEFSNGELAQYKSLVMTFSGTKADETNVKVMYHTSSTSGILKEYTTYGTKIIDLTIVEGLNRSEVTKISLAGNSDSGSIMISSNDVYLTKGVASGGDEEPEQPAEPIEVTLKFEEDAVTGIVGEDFTEPELTVSVDDAEQYVKYTSSDPDVATVNEKTGKVEIIALGTTKITAKLEGTEKYIATEVFYTLTIEHEIKKIDLSGLKESWGNCKWDATNNTFKWWIGSSNLINIYNEKVESKYNTLYFTISDLSVEDLANTDAKGLRLMGGGKCDVFYQETNQQVPDNNIIKNGKYYTKVKPGWTSNPPTIQFGGLQSDFSVNEEEAISLKLIDVYFSTENPLED